MTGSQSGIVVSGGSGTVPAGSSSFFRYSFTYPLVTLSLSSDLQRVDVRGRFLWIKAHWASRTRDLERVDFTPKSIAFYTTNQVCHFKVFNAQSLAPALDGLHKAGVTLNQVRSTFSAAWKL